MSENDKLRLAETARTSWAGMDKEQRSEFLQWAANHATPPDGYHYRDGSSDGIYVGCIDCLKLDHWCSIAHRDRGEEE